MTLDKNDDLVFTLSAENNLYGFGKLGDRLVLIESDCQDGINTEDYVIIDLMDYLLYRRYIVIMFKANPDSKNLYLNRFSLNTGNMDCLQISKKEFIILEQWL